MKRALVICLSALALTGCRQQQPKFNYIVDRFYDLEILRYQVPQFEELTLQQKELLYYLSEAALQGRDILYDQNCKYNLCIRRTLEAIYTDYPNKTDEQYLLMEKYLKRVWFSNGIHHHYSEDKFLPEFTETWFTDALAYIPDTTKAELLQNANGIASLEDLVPIMFDPTILPKRTNQADGVDLILTSANNYYDGVTQAEAAAYYAAHRDDSAEPVSVGLNAKLVKRDGIVQEDVYKVGGLYGAALEKVVYWLEKAREVAENEQQRLVIDKLIAYNQTGDLNTFNEYCIAWVRDLESRVDFVNGFTETYGDPLGMTASWEAMVNFKDLEATARTTKISENAQWFEDNSPTDKAYKKEEVKGVTAKVINAAILGGDCYPATPIGINLPNANWIRKEYGSKSVTIENITDAYNQAALGNGFNEEFMYSDKEVEAARLYGALTNSLHTDLHECLGHGSGKLLPGISKDALKEHASTIEEARADLFGLYYMADAKLVELGLLPTADAYQTHYYQQMMNGAMTQLVRIEEGKDVEEAHMRNRQLIANWVLAHVDTEEPEVEFVRKDGKTYLHVNDYQGLRRLYGDLLAIIQEITSTGNYDAAKTLVETYAVRVNPELHKEVLQRYATLNLAPYKGFVNPVYTPQYDALGNIKDITISYNEGYTEQHLRYSHDYSPLPTWN
ncbi:MAG: dipeptidyl peptidase 3 [Paludibacter sp.]|nr:dipeptidyl peptidase 3 [Bacteroidales bacterium]MCM1068344.1 dipeptidyl peptidase 3 [Prevotella sp.]MCM1354028.1 dipeptidyl peptidase 3 [Bacteroides sp.]MCM1442130.1 dipeptidyl peptidase 3 [Muribaculum sp.]MCM1481977.1 dipeptidyl peptidase 3 [Paludibacter sp.]